MNERDREAADDWMRDHLPDPDECSLEDNEEEGSTQSYFFLRYRDSATVVYKVSVEDGKRICGFTVVPSTVGRELDSPLPGMSVR